MGGCLSNYQNTVPPTSFRFRYGMFGRINLSIDEVCVCDACRVYRPSVDSELNTKKILKKYTDTPRPDVIN